MEKCISCMCLCVFLLMITGCKSVISTSENKQIEEKSFIDVSKNYDVYSLIDPDSSEFNRMIENNSIDAEYIETRNTAVTTKEFIEVEKEYISHWKNEMNIKFEELLKSLSEEEARVLSEAQSKWEEQLIVTMKADYMILQDEMGSSFEWQWLSVIREQYRERSIHFEYLIYLLGKGNNCNE